MNPLVVVGLCATLIFVGWAGYMLLSGMNAAMP